jgi:TonB family protein
VLQSVLDWHFTRDAAGGTRVVEVAFALAKSRVLQDGVVGGVTGGVPAGVPGGVTGGVPGFVTRDSSTQLDDSTQSHIAGIVVSGLSDQVRDQLLATLPVHKGDDVTADGLRRVSQAVKDFDEHLTFHQIRGQAGVTLLIAAGPPPRETLDEARGAVIAPDGAANPSERIKVGGNMQAMKIVRKEAPVYPELAKSARVQGVVHLAAVIAKDGTMLELHSLGGPALLIQSAMDAVRQWVYQPTYLNGQPVVVETTIDVNFTLSQ